MIFFQTVEIYQRSKAKKNRTCSEKNMYNYDKNYSFNFSLLKFHVAAVGGVSIWTKNFYIIRVFNCTNQAIPSTGNFMYMQNAVENIKYLQKV